MIWSSTRPCTFQYPGFVGCGASKSLDAYASAPSIVVLKRHGRSNRLGWGMNISYISTQ